MPLRAVQPSDTNVRMMLEATFAGAAHKLRLLLPQLSVFGISPWSAVWRKLDVFGLKLIGTFGQDRSTPDGGNFRKMSPTTRLSR
jgi:hypothetical protein